jgi:uncharacterized protein YndB with AHSA1/START domain
MPPQPDDRGDMLRFADALTADAPPRTVWKILHDPGRFPEWWAGFATVDDSGFAPGAEGGETSFTAFLDPSLYQDWDPARPMVNSVRSRADENRVVISCLLAEIEFDWHLEPRDDGRGTRIEVNVAVPARRANRFELQRTIIEASIRRLARLAEAAAA